MAIYSPFIRGQEVTTFELLTPVLTTLFKHWDPETYEEVLITKKVSYSKEMPYNKEYVY